MERKFHMKIFRLFHAQRAELRPLGAALGLGAGQPKLLSYLSAHGSCMQKELADYFEVASEFNGLDLSEKLGLAPTTISYHMNMLVREGFVSVSKRGTGIYYTLNTASLRRFVQELEHFLL